MLFPFESETLSDLLPLVVIHQALLLVFFCQNKKPNSAKVANKGVLQKDSDSQTFKRCT